MSRYVALGYANKLIAAELSVSLDSVATYIRRARQKLRASSRAQLISLAASAAPPPSEPFSPTVAQQLARLDVALTPAERTVAEGLLIGRTYRQIAGERNRSPRTVATQARSVFAKLGVCSRSELTALVFAGWSGKFPPSPK